jgi:uncharacterized protein YecE (DUF72 family)
LRVASSGQIRVGCSGWSYQSWRHGAFYPEGMGQARWLEFYAGEFDTVEANATFYRLTTEKAAERWVEQTPPEFVMAAKASRYMTHIRRLQDLKEPLKRFYAPLAPLIRAHRLGPIIWQLPPNFKRDHERLAETLASVPEGRHAFEFRHPSWFEDGTLDLLRDHGAALVIGDHPEREYQAHELTADFTVVRFHYGRRGRRGNYGPSELSEWAGRLQRMARAADVFAYFNNDWEAFAIRNARALKKLLRQS